MDNMTALVSAFARAYHYRNNHTWVFADPVAEKMLMDEEYTAISQNMRARASLSLHLSSAEPRKKH